LLDLKLVSTEREARVVVPEDQAVFKYSDIVARLKQNDNIYAQNSLSASILKPSLL
jgi:hypothetical protein